MRIQNVLDSLIGYYVMFGSVRDISKYFPVVKSENMSRTGFVMTGASLNVLIL